MTTWICDGCGVEHADSDVRPSEDGCVFTTEVVAIEERGDLGGSSVALTTDGTLLVGDTITGGLHRDWVSFQRNFPKHVPLSPAVVRRIVDRLEPYHYDRLYTLGGDEIDHDAKDVVRRSAETHIRWASGEFDHLT